MCGSGSSEKKDSETLDFPDDQNNYSSIAGTRTGAFSNRTLGPAGSYGVYMDGDIESNGTQKFIRKNSKWVPLA